MKAPSIANSYTYEVSVSLKLRILPCENYEQNAII